MNEDGVKNLLYTWLKREMGSPHVFKINFDVDFVTGNLIDGNFDGSDMDQVAFDTDQATTLKAVAASIQKTLAVFKAIVTGAREITVYGATNGSNVVVVGPTVTGGASQALATLTDIQDPVFVEVIFSDQNAPRPNYPYAVVRFDSIVQIGCDEIRAIDPETNIANIGGQRRGTVSVSYFGPSPMQEIMKAYNSLEKETVEDLFFANRVAILQKNSVQNLTEMLETNFEEHTFFDFYIGFAENIEDYLGIIQDVELTGKYNDTPIGQVIVGPKVIGP